jgi:N-acetylglucosamine-6-phosphate deacetylase
MASVVAADTVVTGVRVLSPGAVTFEAGRIVAVSGVVPDGVQVRRGYLVPGFVDIHCHGGGGATVLGADPEAVARFARAHRAHGTTTICASLVSQQPGPLLRDVRALAELVEDGVIAGTHLEGPWISPEMSGAHDPTALRAPARDEVDAVLAAARGTLRMVTLAPELVQGMATVRRLADAGVLPAIGHTCADWNQAQQAIDSGSVVATHLFNRMRPIDHRQPGPIPALMGDPRMHVELIADGVHVHPAIIAMVRQAVSGERIVLVTDAMAAAGEADGDYLLGDLAVTVSAGAARLADGGALAGSTLTMDVAFRRAVRDCGFSLTDAVLAASVNPARLLGRTDVGSLGVGMAADVVALDADLVLQQVWYRGEPLRPGSTQPSTCRPGQGTHSRSDTPDR